MLHLCAPKLNEKFIKRIYFCNTTSFEEEMHGFYSPLTMKHNHKSPNAVYLMNILTSHLLTCLIEILRGDELISDSNKYTPGEDDRDGITAMCSDTVHSKWRITENVVKSEELRPHCKFK